MTEVVNVSAEAYAAKSASGGGGITGEPTYDHFFDKLLKLKVMGGGRTLQPWGGTLKVWGGLRTERTRA